MTVDHVFDRKEKNLMRTQYKRDKKITTRIKSSISLILFVVQSIENNRFNLGKTTINSIVMTRRKV